MALFPDSLKFLQSVVKASELTILFIKFSYNVHSRLQSPPSLPRLSSPENSVILSSLRIGKYTKVSILVAMIRAQYELQ